MTTLPATKTTKAVWTDLDSNTVRITQDGQRRITEDGTTRITLRNVTAADIWTLDLKGSGRRVA